MLLRRLSVRRTINLFCLLALNNSVPTERILTVVISLSSEGGIIRCAWLLERLEDFLNGWSSAGAAMLKCWCLYLVEFAVSQRPLRVSSLLMHEMKN